MKQEEQTLVVSVLNKVGEMQKTGEIHFPKDYSPQNSVRAAWLALQDMKDKNKKPVLETCTKASIYNCLFRMVTDGLSLAKSQCAFIPKGGKMIYMPQYQGRMTMAKRHGVREVNANVVRKDDIFEYSIDPETGRRRIIKHDTNIENIDKPIVAAYAVLIFNVDCPSHVELMSINQVKKSWNMGFGERDTHKQFDEEMVKKTVISRACKPFVQSSNDSDLDMLDEHKEEKIDNAEEVRFETYENKQPEKLESPRQKAVPEAKPEQAEQAEQAEQQKQAAQQWHAEQAEQQKQQWQAEQQKQAVAGSRTAEAKPEAKQKPEQPEEAKQQPEAKADNSIPFDVPGSNEAPF